MPRCSAGPADIRVRRSPHAVAGREDWVEAWVRIDSPDIAVLDMLALGAEVEVLHPPELRAGVREAATRIAALHTSPAGPRERGHPIILKARPCIRGTGLQDHGEAHVPLGND